MKQEIVALLLCVFFFFWLYAFDYMQLCNVARYTLIADSVHLVSACVLLIWIWICYFAFD